MTLKVLLAICEITNDITSYSQINNDETKHYNIESYPYICEFIPPAKNYHASALVGLSLSGL